MDRDFIGYGGNPPKVKWPKNAQIAINFALNYEEGSERNILDGDDESESYLTDIPGLIPLKNQRHLSSESIFEYGSREGIWRLLNLFDRFNLPMTIFTTGLALERNPVFAEKLKNSDYEVAGHGYRWIDYKQVDEKTEKEHIEKTIKIIQSMTGKTPLGWYTGRRSINTRKLVFEANLLYDSDSYAGDLPYYEKINQKPHLIIPYSLDTNDFRYATPQGFVTGDDFFSYLKNSLDFLLEEGKHFPKMMTIALHPRLSGRPGRALALKKFIEYTISFERVWIAKRDEIANFWLKNYPIE